MAAQRPQVASMNRQHMPSAGFAASKTWGQGYTIHISVLISWNV